MNKIFERMTSLGCLGMLVVALASCGAVMPKLPSQGGPAWREIKSANITLWTNASSKRGFELIQEMEQRHQIIAHAMNRNQQSGRIFAIAMRSDRELQAFAPAEAAAIAWTHENPSRQPGILLAANDMGRDEAEILNHELAHAISYSIIPRQPAWLAEGLASYFEKGSLDEDGEAQIGIPNRNLLITVRQSPMMPAKELFSCRFSACRTLQLYATGWSLLSYLINVHFDRFGKYLQRLNELPREEHLRAWEEIFPDLPPSKIDRELPGWVYSGSFAVPRIKVKVKRHPATERPLGDADVLAMRSLLYWIRGEEPKTRAQVEAALAADRTQPLAALIADDLKIPISVEDARKIAAAWPDDWRALMLLAKKLEPGAERAAAQKRACALAVADDMRCAAKTSDE